MADAMNAADTMNMLSIEELKRRADSLMENIGALRFSAARIELLDGYRTLLRDLLADARVHVEANVKTAADPEAAKATRTLMKRIDKALKETETALESRGS